MFEDIQYLLDEDPNGLDGLLFYLSRLGKNIGLVLIGNIRVDDLCLILEPPTTSSLKLRSVYFPKYNALELKDILMGRASDALTKNAFKRSGVAIAKIAAFSARVWGFSRYALDLLKEAGMFSEQILGKDFIPEDAADQAERMLEASNFEEQLRALPPEAFAVLEAVYCLKRERELPTGNVYSAYEKVCNDMGLDPFSLRKVSDIINELDSAGFISCRLVSRGRQGRTKLISWPSNQAFERVYERERERRF